MASNLPISPTAPENLVAKRVRNFLIALAAIALSIFLVIGFKGQANTGNLTTLAQESIPLEVAIANHKPTLIEFYANWCGTCQAMAKDLSQIKPQYDQQVNFVMLNVDNSKWLPEMTKYRVDGIPHFVFLDKQGQEIAQTIGEVPPAIMVQNLTALASSLPIPHAQTSGQVSSIDPEVTPVQASAIEPRSHGNQVN